ncbi:hypothetical protein PAHAL_5G014200 [Panicum hallii]|uniref:Uncharacterized protein n=1 Tax=Panicum hallii TaxID=206008 RepID=A0A2T8III6_9POAL|nr:hypothetical protein PAHAL_5G014200 [Panicum hallii]
MIGINPVCLTAKLLEIRVFVQTGDLCLRHFGVLLIPLRQWVRLVLKSEVDAAPQVKIVNGKKYRFA